MSPFIAVDSHTHNQIKLLAQDLGVRKWLEDNSVNEQVETEIVNWITFIYNSYRIDDSTEFSTNLSAAVQTHSDNEQYRNEIKSGHYLNVICFDANKNVRVTEEIFLITDNDGKVERYVTVDVKVKPTLH